MLFAPPVPVARRELGVPAEYLALLRGINVGGKNTLPMRDLVELFAAAGCEDVRTYIQSGNVLFNAAPGVAARLPDVITAAIAARFAYRTPVIVRTVAELAQVILHNPYSALGATTETLHVLFLADLPDDRRIASLDAARSPPDAFVVRGREVYLHLPQGAARTKLTNDYFDTRLSTTSTGRNWRTVSKLHALMGV